MGELKVIGTFKEEITSAFRTALKNLMNVEGLFTDAEKNMLERGFQYKITNLTADFDVIVSLIEDGALSIDQLEAIKTILNMDLLDLAHVVMTDVANSKAEHDQDVAFFAATLIGEIQLIDIQLEYKNYKLKNAEI